MVSAMGLMQQRQIDYTRSNESEADRLGIQTLARSHYDPAAMADFFIDCSARSRANARQLLGRNAGLADDPPGHHHPHQRGQGARRTDRRSAPSGLRARPDGPAVPATNLASQCPAATEEPVAGNLRRPRVDAARHRAVRLCPRAPARAQRRQPARCAARIRTPRRQVRSARRCAALRPGRGPPPRQPGAPRGDDAGGTAGQAPGRHVADPGVGRSRSAQRQGRRRRQPLRSAAAADAEQPRRRADLRPRCWPSATRRRRQARPGGAAAAAGPVQRRPGVPAVVRTRLRDRAATRSAPARPMPRPPT